MKRRPCQNLSHHQRERTPLPFCKYLLGRVQGMFPTAEKVAVLWTCKTTLYFWLWPAVELWGVGKDARKYEGPWPVIAHPPCGPWGKLKWNSRQDKAAGILAIEFAHRFGGVIEQPLGSTLFQEHGRGGTIEQVNQGDYGHKAEKATLLYFARPD